MNNQNRVKYDAQYISYVENGDSAAVYIVRDIVETIDTTGKWIDVIKTSGSKNKDNKWDFSSIMVELFPRITRPIYPKDASAEEKKYITWITASEDIRKHKSQGYKGEKFLIRLKLVNKNQGKTKTREKMWDYHIISAKSL